ncbi:hypothetical protein [Speluncibacter jeojiensis]|uniref:Uncharacterized protein n=1 Tax=Speluncibacter jeojiensis TaxID=2710754 RepID=A0A9X4LWP4_9ACTN|nr:hypothetical protein [Corynebacteriales bacterium D3-21]
MNAFTAARFGSPRGNSTHSYSPRPIPRPARRTVVHTGPRIVHNHVTVVHNHYYGGSIWHPYYTPGGGYFHSYWWPMVWMHSSTGGYSAGGCVGFAALALVVLAALIGTVALIGSRR